MSFEPNLKNEIIQAFVGHFELLIILGILVLLFGATKLPALGSGLGSFLRNFKKSMKEAELDVTPEDKKKVDGKSDSKD